MILHPNGAIVGTNRDLLLPVIPNWVIPNYEGIRVHNLIRGIGSYTCTISYQIPAAGADNECVCGTNKRLISIGNMWLVRPSSYEYQIPHVGTVPICEI